MRYGIAGARSRAGACHVLCEDVRAQGSTTSSPPRGERRSGARRRYAGRSEPKQQLLWFMSNASTRPPGGRDACYHAGWVGNEPDRRQRPYGT
eukprot:4339080-Heterocapsa_arctica.AAC.1